MVGAIPAIDCDSRTTPLERGWLRAQAMAPAWAVRLDRQPDGALIVHDERGRMWTAVLRRIEHSGVPGREAWLVVPVFGPLDAVTAGAAS